MRSFGKIRSRFAAGVLIAALTLAAPAAFAQHRGGGSRGGGGGHSFSGGSHSFGGSHSSHSFSSSRSSGGSSFGGSRSFSGTRSSGGSSFGGSRSFAGNRSFSDSRGAGGTRTFGGTRNSSSFEHFGNSGFGGSRNFANNQHFGGGFHNGFGGEHWPGNGWRGSYWHGVWHEAGWFGWSPIFALGIWAGPWPVWFYSDPYYMDYCWDSIGEGCGLGASLNVAYDDPCLVFGGAYGAAYPVASVAIDLNCGVPERELRAHFFEKPYFYRGGSRFDRVEVTRGGDRFYEFHRHAA